MSGSPPRGPVARDSGGGKHSTRRRGRRFAGPALRWAALGLLLIALAFGSWLGVSALSVKTNLEQARNSAQQVKDALLRGETQQASKSARDAVAFAQSARDSAHSAPWGVAAAVPFLGSPFRSGQQMSQVVVDLATDILQPATDSAIGLSPARLYSDGRINVQLLRQQQLQLQTLAESAARLEAQAAAVTQPAFPAAIRKARTGLQQQTAGLAGTLRNSALAAQIGPSMMGADGPRAYLMAFQTNAEARGTGGLLGGFGVLRFDNGRPTVDTLAPNTELIGATAAVDLGSEFQALYGWTRAFTDFRNSNLSSHFPHAAQIWKSMWERQTEMRVDGVIGLDPIALKYLLAVEGPVTLPGGEVVTADNVVELTESTAYARYATDQEARKRYLQDIANEVAKKATGQVRSPGKLLEALGKAAGEGRVAVWSAFPDEQRVLEQTPLGHVIPDDPAPYAEVVINNLGGNKMDYYLRREISYTADGCSGDMRKSEVAVKLANTATDVSGLPEYVAGFGGLAPELPVRFLPGTMVTSVKVLATQGARLLGVTSNGRPIAAIPKSERGHPTYEVQVAIPPGQSGELVFQLAEPPVPGAPRVPVQPLIDSPVPVVSVPEC